MDTTLKTALWQQFGAAIDMLDNAVRACPDQLWEASLWDHPSEPAGYARFWYIAYHTLFWLDLYLSGAVEDFTPPPPFTLDELDPAGLLPERVYTREELETYLEHCRKKCQVTIGALNDASAARRSRFSWGEVTFFELMLYTMRHVQEHASQLALFIGQQVGPTPGWVSKARR